MILVKVGEDLQIKGLNHKTKNRIRNHGKFWFVARICNPWILLQEASPKDPSTPYCFWGALGGDFEIIL